MEIDHAEIAKRLLTDREFTVGLGDLIGEFDLSGVDRDSTLVGNDWNGNEDCQILSFILNDIVFTAVEDPNDGYRSSMRHVLVEKFEVHNEFQPIRVYTKYRQDNSHEIKGIDDDWYNREECDILEMYDKDNDKVILKIGTSNTSDYYPYFVAEWRPESMAINDDIV